MEIFRDNPKAACGCCCTIVVVILAIVGIAFCAATVEPIAYGLKYDTLSKNIDNTTVYDGGWYIIGPFSKFLQFPSTQVNVDFSDLPGSKQRPLDARSGTPIKISFSFQYQLKRDTLTKLYSLHNTRYESELIMVTARTIIVEQASYYNVTDYWGRRQEIGEKMRIALDNALLYANCVGFQLLKVELQKTNEDSLVKTQVQTQQGFKMKYEQDASNITAAIAVDTSESQKVITILNGEATANATEITLNVEGYVKNKTITAQATAYQQAALLTGQSASDTLMQYIYYTSIINNKNSTVLVGVDRAMLSLAGKGY